MTAARQLTYTLSNFLSSKRIIVGAIAFATVATTADLLSTSLVTALVAGVHEGNPFVRHPVTHAFIPSVGALHSLYWILFNSVGVSWIVYKLTGSQNLASLPPLYMGFMSWGAMVANMRYLIQPLFWVLY